MKTIADTELRVGDTIEVWWAPHRDTITALYPCLQGGQIAKFAILKGGMTIEPGSKYTLIARGGA